MKTIVHKANSRGRADYGWLKTNYSFSFANYYDPTRIHFGALRVLNDDFIEGGHGFDKHPHDNMEIITLMLEGELKHQDSMGNVFVLHENEIQTMSAGTGIFHSEYNNKSQDPAKLLQIWVFPKQRDITPQYGLSRFDSRERNNKWQLLVSPAQEGTATIRQDAYFSMATMDQDLELDYTLYQPGNGVYIFMIDGKVDVEGITLQKRDGLGISDIERLKVRALDKTEILLMEIPMIW